MWKCGSVEICRWGNMEMGMRQGSGEMGGMMYGNGHWRTWFLRAVIMLAEKMRVKETASSMRATNLRFST